MRTTTSFFGYLILQYERLFLFLFLFLIGGGGASQDGGGTAILRPTAGGYYRNISTPSHSIPSRGKKNKTPLVAKNIKRKYRSRQPFLEKSAVPQLETRFLFPSFKKFKLRNRAQRPPPSTVIPLGFPSASERTCGFGAEKGPPASPPTRNILRGVVLSRY